MVKLKRWVVKAGSQMVCNGGPILIRSWMQQVLSLRRQFNTEIIWVTSGAIASAREKTQLGRSKKVLAEKQALSAIGQPMVMDLYNLALNSVGLIGAQILVTYDDMAHIGRKKNLKNSLEKLLDWKVVPILNENDAVATEEIRFGDNDSLSAAVATHLGADRLIILTDVLGFYDSNPQKNKNAQLISELPGITSGILKQQGLRSKTERGTGGMYSKLLAAQMATRQGVETWLVQGDINQVLLKVAQGDNVGTRILGRRNAKKA